jgi:Reverse transcriptase (RNA-dependent DNA polymerase).
MIYRLLKFGYFPTELPNVFYTEKYGDVLIAQTQTLPHPYTYGNKGPKYISSPARFNLARIGKLRRVISIPNPVNYFQLAELISNNWADLEIHFNNSTNALSKPTLDQEYRALRWKNGFSTLPSFKLKTRTGARFILKADISNFYSTIYTHSIPWALHSKLTAKQQRNFADNLGNKIDTIIRNGQDQQTKGIPIGPDTSFAVSEILMCDLDSKLSAIVNCKFHRYIDDIEFGCKTRVEAEQTLAKLQEILSSYELDLNNIKTKIIELPTSIEPNWLHQLRSFDLVTTNDTIQKLKLLEFYDLSVRLLKEADSEPVFKYTAKLSASIVVSKSNFDIYLSMLLQWALLEPSTLRHVVDIIKAYKDKEYQINIHDISDTLQQIIAENATKGCTSEIVWAVWGALICQIPIPDETANILSKIENPFVALLTIDARRRGLINNTVNFDLWNSLMNANELNNGNWLLAYEALVKNWLPSVNGNNYCSNDNGFKILFDNNVEFYRTNAIEEYQSLLIPIDPATVQYAEYGMTATDSDLEDYASIQD